MSRFEVTGLHCDGCVKRVTGSLQELDPASVVSLDLATGILTIDRSAVTAADIVARVQSLGYGVQPVS